MYKNLGISPYLCNMKQSVSKICEIGIKSANICTKTWASPRTFAT